jgi:hypothetical protein
MQTNKRNEDLFAKEQLKRFIQLKYDEQISFTTAKGEGEATVRRMRVKLSKLRNKALAKRLTVRTFKMYVISIIDNQDNTETVTLRMTQSAITGVADALSVLEDGEFSGLISGKMV